MGWVCVATGLFDLVVELDQSGHDPDVPYLILHVVLVVCGATLLGLDRIRPVPGTARYATGAAVTVAGVIASAVPATTSLC